MKYAFRIPAASELDLTGMENWLEELALKGLYLKWFRSYLCCFTRGEPKKVRVRLEPNPRHALEIGLPEDKEEFYREAGWRFACEISNNALVFYAEDPNVTELHTDPTLLVGHMRALYQRSKRNNWLLAVLLMALAGFLLWRTPRYGLTTPQEVLTMLYDCVLCLSGLATVLLDIPSLQKMKELERDMEAGIPPARLPTSRSWRRQQLVRGTAQLLFYLNLMVYAIVILLFDFFF